MSERDVLEEARDWLGRGYPESDGPEYVARLADALVESRSEVDEYEEHLAECHETQPRVLSYGDQMKRERDEALAAIERVREANILVHAHRFDLDDDRGSEHDDWLRSFGEERKGGPDIFYAGVEFAYRRIDRALDGGDQS